MIVELLELNWCNGTCCLWICEEICGCVGVLRKIHDFDEMSHFVVSNA
jgi:hypothetical protein